MHVNWVSKMPLTAENVALELQLPVFNELTIGDFIKLREDEQPHFDRFRSALRQAISERLTPENKNKTAAKLLEVSRATTCVLDWPI